MISTTESQTVRKQQFAVSEHMYPISEIFGPTIQGEGPLAGMQTFFLRFAGCEYDCSWCVAKGQRVRMADGTLKPIETIKTGDKVLGVSSYPETFVVAEVTDAKSMGHKSVVRFGPAIVTPDHKVYDATTHNYKEARHFASEHSFVWTPCPLDWDGPSWLSGYLDGDGSFYGQVRADGGWQSKFKVTSTDEVLIDTAETVLKEFGFNPRRVRHNAGKGKFKLVGAKTLLALEITRTKEADALEEFVTLHRSGPSWLGGFFDAEGSFDGVTVKYAQKKPIYRAFLLRRLEEQGYEYAEYGVTVALRLGGQRFALRFLALNGSVLGRKWANLMGHRVRSTNQYTPIERLEEPHEVFDLTTSTGNFFAEGVLVHNCDTKYAVSPKYNGWQSSQMYAEQVAFELTCLGANADSWVTLSGGNPALFVDHNLVRTLTERGSRLAMETQGSRVLKPNVQVLLDCLVVSPKPPSSGMANRIDFGVLHELLYYRTERQITALKFVVFDEEDMAWAFDTYTRILSKGASFMTPPYLSIGTDLRAASLGQAVVREQVLTDYQRVVEQALKDERFKCFVVLPQLHVLLWGQKRGV